MTEPTAATSPVLRFIRTEVIGRVGVLTLDRPDQLNAMSNVMDEEFFVALRALEAHPDVRCILWRAEGRAFSAGRDVNELGNRAPGQSDYHYIEAGHKATHETLVPSPWPIVCAVQGWCIGGSFERTLLCDMRIAADDAKFRLPELSHGLIPDSGGTARLFQMCGHGIVTDLVLTGRVMDAEEAFRHGIVSRVVARDELDNVSMEVATSIARLAPLAVRAWRQNLNDLGMAMITRSLHDEFAGQMVVYKSDDFAEFKLARTENREPNYRIT